MLEGICRQPPEVCNRRERLRRFKCTRYGRARTLPCLAHALCSPPTAHTRYPRLRELPSHECDSRSLATYCQEQGRKSSKSTHGMMLENSISPDF